MSAAVVGDARDGAAAGADRVDVDHRQRAAASCRSRPSVVTSASPPADEADVGAGAADVDGDEVVEAGRLADTPRADHAGGGPGQRGVDGLRAHDVGADDAAVGLHDRQRGARRPRARSRSPSRADVAADERLHVGVEHGAPSTRSNSRNTGSTSLDSETAQPGCSASISARARRSCGGIGVAVQEAHGDGVDARLAQPAGRRAHRRLVERLQLRAVDGHAAADLEDALGRDRPAAASPRRTCWRAGGCRGGRSPARRGSPRW